uniref:Chitin-binding type-2 domain-containing protein n=1 Tax=Biomphalaria glabrata TaxID=6526 RepID=A0A2C9KXA2_BIOGL
FFVSPATFKCPSLFNFYPDVHDCSKFYRCIWGKGAAFNCPSGTLWSQDLLTCNHAKEVQCDKPSVSEEMKDFEAPDFSVDIKKSKGSHSSDDDGEDSNDEDNKADSSWSDSKEDPHKNHKHTKEDSYYTNYDTDYGESGGYEYKAKKDNSKPTHQKMTNGQYKTAPESQEYHHVISHIPQPQHFVHHFQPTPYVLPAPQEYKSS